MAKAKEKEQEPVVVTPEHAIIYCDGGHLLDKRVGGWGVHCYTYLHEEPKRGTGNPKVVPTTKGYLFEGKGGDKVTVHQYVDMAGGLDNMASSNEVEMNALVNAMEWLDQNPEIKHAQVFTDSMFTVNGTTKWINTWISRRWTSANGEPVKYRPTWEKIKALYDKLQERMESFTLEYVKGHNGHPGNEKADQLASRGIAMQMNKDTETFSDTREAQGYWNFKNEIPRILQAPRWYFSTVDEEYKNADGTYTYYVGTHGTKDKEDDLPGKRYSDNFLGVVRVTEPDAVMEVLREAAIKKDIRRHGSIIIGYLDTIFSPKTYRELTDHKTRFALTGGPRIDVFDAKKNPIAIELKPLGLGFRKADIWRTMSNMLAEIREGSTLYRKTDITDLLYEEPDAKKGTRKLKSAINQVTKYLDFQTEFNLEKASDEAKPFLAKIRLILGSDILSRNQLAALGEDVKSVQIVSWRESDQVGRYGTLVELKSGCIGLWARFEANLYYKVR